MPRDAGAIMPLHYTNPVWPGYLADPFVLRHDGLYYAYGTGSSRGDSPQRDRRVFPVLRSPDLTHWEDMGGALRPLEGGEGVSYWAPEAARGDDGRFFLYYSADAPDGVHRLRVAVADRPEGPFEDMGRWLLPDEGFTIDAHPFRDPADGRWFLFFAKDFPDGERAGTALAVVGLSDDMVSVSGAVTTVLRASADWQVYERRRALYGRTWDAWHTLEGPCIVAREGRYWCLYSGGAWHGPDYGVGVAVAETVLGPYTEIEAGPVVLRGVPGRVLGPGHNSVVRGPDGATDFIVYHAWDPARTGRRMCLAPLRWTPDGPRCPGPTWTPQALGLPP